MKTTVLPLGYQGEIKPDQTKQCDLPHCNISSQDENWTLLHGYFHSFHDVCLNGLTSCPLCKDFLKQKVKELGEIAKKAILHPASTMNVHESQTDHSDETSTVPTDESSTEISGLREMEREEFDRVIRQLNNELANLNPAAQPLTSSNLSQSQIHNKSAPLPNKAPPHCRKCHHPVRGHKRYNNNAQVKCNFCENGICTVSADISCLNCPCLWHTANQAGSSQSTCNNQSASSPRPDSQTTLRITVTSTQHLDVTGWLLPSYICQSSIGGGLSGSNACTVIAVLTALNFLEGTLQIPKHLQDLSLAIPMYTNVMMKGNQLYNSFKLPAQQLNLEVRQVLQHGRNDENLQKLEIISDLGFFSVRDLEDHLTQHHHQHPSFAAVLIVPCFKQTSICLFESHTHGLEGGVIAASSSGNVRNFVTYLERMVMRDWKVRLQGSNRTVVGLK